MSNLVEQVRASVPPACIPSQCSKEGCSVRLTGAPKPFVMIDMDCHGLQIGHTSRRCDFIFASDDKNWVVPIELKKGKLQASEVVEQLRAGAKFAERIISKSTAVRFLPIAVCGGKIHRIEHRKLRSKASRIQFRGQYVYIELLKCGQALTEALRR